MRWLGWYELMLLSMMAAGVCMGIAALATINNRLGRNIIEGASVTLGLMGGTLALAVSMLIVFGAADHAWPRVLGYVGTAGGMAGFLGSVLVKKHRKAAGIVMLAAGLLTAVTVAGPALLMTGGALASNKAQTLTVRRAVVRALRIVMSMVFLILILVPVFFIINRVFLLVAIIIFAAYLAVMILDYIWSHNSRPKQAASEMSAYQTFDICQESICKNSISQ